MTEEEQQTNDQSVECGRLLRRTREGLGLSVADIAAELHLSKNQMQALEEDEGDRRRGIPYARGYLRSYARRSNLDPEELLAGATTQEMEINRAAAEAEEQAADESQPASIERAPGRGWAWIAGVAVVAVLGVGGWQLSRQPAMLPDVLSDWAPNEPAVTSGVDESGRTAFARPGHDAAIAVSGGSTADADSTAESAQPSTTPQDRRRVVLQFEAGSWVDVRDADGERLLYRSYQPGRRIEIEGTPPFRVFLGNAPGVQLEYRGDIIVPEPAPGRRFARFALGRGNG